MVGTVRQHNSDWGEERWWCVRKVCTDEKPWGDSTYFFFTNYVKIYHEFVQYRINKFY